MAKERKCVLCEVVCLSKQEMEEHIRSMLHHRELEKLKGRDCGHECQVCKMKVVSLTDYASHISGSSHKQKVAATNPKAGDDCGEDYFDQALVDLIHKRKEKDASTAKLAKEGKAKNQKEVFQQILKEDKDHHSRDFCWRQPSRQFGRSAHHSNWYNQNSGGPLELPWHSNNRGQTATWHAQETPNLQRWASREFMNNQEWRSSSTWGQGSFPLNSQIRLPWLSSVGSTNEFYGRNNISRFDLRGSSMNFSGGPSMGPSLPNFCSQFFNNNHGGGNGQYYQHVSEPKKMDRQSVQRDHRPLSSKTTGSNQRPDKACRWSPYCITKGPEQVPYNDTIQNFSEKEHRVSRDQQKMKKADFNSFNCQFRREQKPQQATSDWQIIGDTRKQQQKLMIKPSDSSSGISRCTTSHIEQPQIPPSHLQESQKPSFETERKISSTPDLSAAQLSKAFGQATLKSTRIQSSLKSSWSAPPKRSSSQLQLQKSLKKAKQLMLKKRSCLDSSSHNWKETAEVKQKEDQSYNMTSCLQKRLFCNCKGLEKASRKSSNCSQNVQSLQVSTSTTETCEVSDLTNQRSRKKIESQTLLEAPDGPTQVVEARQSSEREVLKCVEALMVPRLSRLDHPPILKHDLTKHTSSKSKAICHGLNLKIAHHVHNLSESCCSNSEKGPLFKPSVQQLISSSESRRNIKWKQIYLEIQQKQDKGKGMPRFGIEMVPCEQACHSLEDDDIPLLDRFKWESLMDGGLQSTSHKRSLSQSSLAPAFTASVLSTPESKDTVKENGAESQVSARPSNHRPVIQSQTEDLQPGFCPPVTMVHKQPDKAMSWSVKALLRSHAVLGDNSSGMEQLDSQGTIKRRRASADHPAKELSCLEHKNKRRKLKCKKERQQINQLLCVSLSEDKLSRSLHVVDTNLIQAWAMLEAAYLEVQRLMVVKQQMTEKMNTLRNKRIELLLGMQDTVKEASQMKLKQEKLDSLNLESLVPSNEAASYTPPTSSSFIPIKEEPSSPVIICSEIDPAGWPKSTTPELSGGQVYSSESVLSFPLSPQSNVELNQNTTKELGDYKETLQEPMESVEGLVKSAERVVDIETAKRVRKLRKRKTLKKALGLEQPESTDTELDVESSRPRWLQSRHRASGTPQASTFSLLPDDSHMKAPQLSSPQLPLDKMEVTTQSQASVPDTSKPETQSLACNEVSSTSDLDLCKLSENDMPLTIKLHKNSSDTSSNYYEDNMPSEGAFEGHQEAVNALQIHDGLLYTCSGDRTIKVFNLVNRQCVGVLEGHSAKVSCLLVSTSSGLPHHLYSGSSDQTIRCYNLKTRELEQLFSLSDRVLCLHSRWRSLFAGLANGTVVSFDLKTNRQMNVFECHRPRAVSCLASSQEGPRCLLLVGSYDSTISVRDARNGLLLRLLEGHSKTVLCMKVVNDLVFSGSSDQCVHKHNIHTGKLLGIYKGHSHAVTVVTILGNVMMTACLDKLVRVYDLQSHEQLQVYSGHSDMVMCMAIHKNMIYTGCYNGSVHAVKLNLMQSFRCRWHGCLLVFGVMDHLQQHLISDHGGSNQLLKCQWKNCKESFGSHSGSKQGTLLHMHRHTVEETRV